MKIYRNENVFDAALTRIRWLFDEFPQVIVNFSGGKDSTVTLNLALQVAEEKGRLPLKVMFLDQEAEWQSVIDYIRNIMSDPRVDPVWLQVPIKIFNATSTVEPWLYCWEIGKEREWIRPKEPNSIKVNRYGTDRFAKMFTKVLEVDFPPKSCFLSGVRCEESPGRFMGLTSHATYKWATFGKVDNKKRQQFTFYPLYDWSYTDSWKAIHDYKWAYCKIYDYMYQYGVSVQDMRVSNVHHETAVVHLFHLQEIEGETWQKITERIPGINTAGHLGKDDFFLQKELPYMFNDWREYRDHLLQHLLTSHNAQEKFKKRFLAMDDKFRRGEFLFTDPKKLYRAQINAILTNDFHMTKLHNFDDANTDKHARRLRLYGNTQAVL